MKRVVYYNFGSRLSTLVFSVFLPVFVLLQVYYLAADGWGKTTRVVAYEGAVWNEVYFDMSGLYFTAFVPNYAGARMQNDEVSIIGHAGNNSGYLIVTSVSSEFTPPKTSEAFVKMVRDANRYFIVIPVEPTQFGAKYAVDLTPMGQKEPTFWRLLSTDNRLIKMGCSDSNENRRINFFDSIYIE